MKKIIAAVVALGILVVYSITSFAMSEYNYILDSKVNEFLLPQSTQWEKYRYFSELR